MSERKAKRKLPAASLANLRRNPPRSKKRKPLTWTQLEFCALVARGINVAQASLELGVDKANAYKWRWRNELIAAQIEEYREQLKLNAFDTVAEKIELRTEFLDI